MAHAVSELTWNTLVLPLKTILVKVCSLHIYFCDIKQKSAPILLSLEKPQCILSSHTLPSIYFTTAMWKVKDYIFKLTGRTSYKPQCSGPPDIHLRDLRYIPVSIFNPHSKHEQWLRNTLRATLILLGWLHLTASEQLENLHSPSSGDLDFTNI